MPPILEYAALMALHGLWMESEKAKLTLISGTRLRIRSMRFLPSFLIHTVRSQSQIKAAPGFRGGALLADRAWTFWTLTAWDSHASMRDFMTTGPHRAAMPHLMTWCDEASVVHWEQETAALPSWIEADRRMRTEGRPSKIHHPSPDHASLSYREPRTTATGPIRPARTNDAN